MNNEETKRSFQEVFSTENVEEILAYVNENPDDPVVQEFKEFFQYYLEESEAENEDAL